MGDKVEIFRNLINKKFKGHKIKKLEELIKPMPKRNDIIKAGTLILIPIIKGSLVFKTFDEDRKEKPFFIPLEISELGYSYQITNKYLQWFMSQEYVVDFLSGISTGSVQPVIKKSILLKIPVPIPKNNMIKTISQEIQIQNEFRTFVHKYYEDYKFNFDNKKYNTCSILAGIISEAILYQLLIDNDVPKNLLDKDRGLGLGKLTTYVELMKLNLELDFDTKYFKEVAKLRNNAVHYGVVRRSKKFKKVNKDSLVSFDYVIKQFGI